MGQAATTDLPARWAGGTLEEGQIGSWESKLSSAIVALPSPLTSPGAWVIGGPHSVTSRQSLGQTTEMAKVAPLPDPWASSI